MDGKSLNIKEQLIRRLNDIVPGAFTDGKLNIGQFTQILGEPIINPDPERYQLSWTGKSKAYKILQTPISETLMPDFANSVNWDNAANVIIEGENLKVLKVIQKSYYGKIKFILIDPPYNTGSDSFIYQDKFSETKEEYLKRIGDKDDEGYMGKEGLFRPNRKENGQFHSNWLSMMLPRLFLARNLLKENGAILVHIDEHEQANLTLLLNEIFGEENFIGDIVWDKGNPKGDATGIAYQHESMLAYAKNKEKFVVETSLTRKKKNADKILRKASDLFRLLGKKETPEEIKRIHKEYHLPDGILDQLKREYSLDEINKQFNSWLKKQDFTAGELAYNKIDGNGDVYRLVSMAWPNKKKAPDDYFIPLAHPVTNKPCPVPMRGWRFPSKTMKELLNKGEIIFGVDDSVQPQRKYLLKENLYENLPSILFYGGSDDSLLKKLNLEFENPKPVEFTKSLIQSFTNINGNDIVLDFFAGSGTTAHAVIEANMQDGGNRRFICVQLDEKIDGKSNMRGMGYKSIADITVARIKSVMEKFNEELSGKPNPEDNAMPGVRKFVLTNSNFKVWRGEFIDNEDDLKKQMNLFLDCRKSNSGSIGILWELLIKNGKPLTEKVRIKPINERTMIFISEDNKTVFCLEAVDEPVISEILKIKPHTVICLDSLFNKNDCYKTNILLKFEENNIEFKTI